jgi:hypothetical protein
MWRRPAIAEEHLVDDAVREDEYAGLAAEVREKALDDVEASSNLWSLA